MKRGDSEYDVTYADRAREALRAFTSERTQTEAARVLGVDQGTISRNLRVDRQPSFKIIIALAKATGRTVDDIVGLTRERDRELRKMAEAVGAEVARKLRESQPPPPPPSHRRPSHPPPKRTRRK